MNCERQENKLELDLEPSEAALIIRAAQNRVQYREESCLEPFVLDKIMARKPSGLPTKLIINNVHLNYLAMLLDDFVERSIENEENSLAARGLSQAFSQEIMVQNFVEDLHDNPIGEAS